MRVASRRTRFRLSLGLAVSLAVAALGVGSSLDAQEPPKFVTIQVNDPSGEGSVVFPNLIGGVITCFDTCMFEGPAGATWQFTAQGPNFSGWTGCTGVSGPDNRICDLLLGQETTITAAFGAAPPPPPPPPIPSNPLDFGDAPDSYKTLLASDGPRHALGLVGSYLGIFPPDFENDGHPTADATGDDLSGSADEPADEQESRWRVRWSVDTRQSTVCSCVRSPPALALLPGGTSTTTARSTRKSSSSIPITCRLPLRRC